MCGGQIGHSHQCVCSHQCRKNPPMQKLIPARTKSAAQIINKKYKSPLTPIQDNEQCHITFKPQQFGSSLEVEQLLKQLQKREHEAAQAQQLWSSTQIENRKLKQQNRHIQTQMEYLRTQLNTLINNHNIDIKGELRRHLQENKELNLEIQKLTNQLIDAQNSVQNLEAVISDYKVQKGRIERSESSISDKYLHLTDKHKELVQKFQVLKEKATKDESELKKVNEKYRLLVCSLEAEDKTSKKRKNQLQKRLQKLQKESVSAKRSLTNEKKLFQIERAKLNEVIVGMEEKQKKTNATFEKEKQKVKKLLQENSLLKDDLEQSKRIVLKYEDLKAKYPNDGNTNKADEKQHLSGGQSQSDEEDNKKTIERLQGKNGIKNEGNTEETVVHLKEENGHLMKRVQELESQLLKFRNGSSMSKMNEKSVLINQELILEIGASEEFKKIVNEKNETIKRLMKEKKDLYAKLYHNSYDC